jgi:hypothetical protein
MKNGGKSGKNGCYFFTGMLFPGTKPSAIKIGRHICQIILWQAHCAPRHRHRLKSREPGTACSAVQCNTGRCIAVLQCHACRRVFYVSPHLLPPLLLLLLLLLLLPLLLMLPLLLLLLLLLLLMLLLPLLLLPQPPRYARPTG